LPLDIRVALVTGSSRGIGRAVAHRLAADGYAVVVHGATEHSADGTAEEIEARHGGPVLSLHGDVADAQQLKEMGREIFSRFRRLDALVVNAGAHEAGMLGMTSEAAVQRVFAVNAVGATLTLQMALPLLRRGTDPAIVLVSSVMAETAAPGQSVYAASKAAVSGLTRAAARELGAGGIRVNAVAPGYVQTDMLDSLDDEGRAKCVSATILGRLGEPEDVADAAAFLLSTQSRFVTGQVLGVDGGVVV
jgi:3-oxoacyl-[acyl-carrier protein] reductase